MLLTLTERYATSNQIDVCPRYLLLKIYALIPLIPLILEVFLIIDALRGP